MSSDPIIGRKLGDYLIVDILGQGGMAKVYRGLDKKLNRYAAVKVIDASTIREDAAEYRQRFQNEARAIGRLSHPNIVSIYQYDQIDNLYYMAMNFIEGRDLRSILKAHDKSNTYMTGPEVLRIIKDIGEALDYAHTEGVIHRDIKPSNIMVTGNGRAILTDFGLALSVPDGTIGNTFGSAHYIAPEQAVSSAQAVPQSDIYSLGIVLFEMLTNRVPFDDPSAMAVAMKHLTDPPPPPSRINPHLSPEVDKVVVRALDKEPKKRYLNCAEMIAHLEKALAVSDDVVLEMLNMVIKPPATPPPASTPASTPILPSQPVPPVSSAANSTPTKGGMETRPMVDDSPTITDSKASAASRKQLMREVNRRKWIQRLTPVVVIAAAIGIGALLLSQTSQQVATNEVATLTAVNTVTRPTEQSAEPTQAVAVAATDTNAPQPSATPEPEASDTPAPANTVTALPLDATSEPTINAVQVALTPLENTPVPSGSTGDISKAPILIRYDDQVITLYNQSGKTLNLSNLTFVQTLANGRTAEFDSDDWSQDGSRSVSTFPNGDCLQVSRIDRFLATSDIRPDYCNFVQGWRKIAITKLFWISDAPDATFEIRRGSTVLAVCSIPVGECGLDPSGRA
ncbi:MAG: protein kinase [Anaerolineae bacterium]